MTLNATEIFSLSRLGFIFYERGRPQKALAIFHGLLHLDPNYAYGWYIVGLIRRDQEDLPGAVEALEHALTCAPQHWAARVALAELYHRSEQLAHALSTLKPMLRLAEENRPALEQATLRRAKTLWHCWQR